MKKIFSSFIKDDFEIKKHGFAFNKNLILKNKKLIKHVLNEDLILNLDFFKIRYQNYLNGNYEHEQYIWNEIILNFSRQNIENKI